MTTNFLQSLNQSILYSLIRFIIKSRNFINCPHLTLFGLNVFDQKYIIDGPVDAKRKHVELDLKLNIFETEVEDVIVIDICSSFDMYCNWVSNVIEMYLTKNMKLGNLYFGYRNFFLTPLPHVQAVLSIINAQFAVLGKGEFQI